MPNNNKMRWFAMAAGCLLLCACAKDQQAQTYKPSKDELARQDASKSAFEKAGDPPINYKTRVAAADLCAQQGNLEGAIKNYQAALKMKPGDPAVLYAMAVLYTEAKRYPDAVEIWKQYVKASDESANSYNNLGFCQELAGHLDDAEASYKHGIEHDPRNQPCQVDYGLMLARQGRINEATLHLQTVLRPAEVHYNLASVYEAQGRKERAATEYEAALKLEPDLLDAKTRLSALDKD